MTCPVRNLWSDHPVWSLSDSELVRPAMWHLAARQAHYKAPFWFTDPKLWRKIHSNTISPALTSCATVFSDCIILMDLTAYSQIHLWRLTGLFKVGNMSCNGKEHWKLRYESIEYQEFRPWWCDVQNVVHLRGHVILVRKTVLCEKVSQKPTELQRDMVEGVVGKISSHIHKFLNSNLSSSS